MTYGPAIYISFYHRFVRRDTPCARIGGGPLSDVIESVQGPGLCVLTSLRWPPSEPIARLGRAGFDPITGALEQRPLPPLDADGAPLWLFWEGKDLTLLAVTTLLSSPTGWAKNTKAVWVELRQGVGRVLPSGTRARLALEAAWTATWPDGPLVVRCAGTPQELARWMETDRGESASGPNARNVDGPPAPSI